MMRFLIWLAVIAAVTYGLTELGEIPAVVSLNFPDRVIEMDLLPAVIFALIALMAAIIVWIAISALIRSPARLGRHILQRRRDKGFDALSEGLLAAASGEATRSRRACEDARYLLGEHPLVLLLSAETARINLDRETFEDAHQAMLEEPATRLLGLKGLYLGCMERGDNSSAMAHLEEALDTNTDCIWALEASFERCTRQKEWMEALDHLRQLVRLKVLTTELSSRLHAVLLTSEAQQCADIEPARAISLAGAAHREHPEFVPAAALLADLEIRSGKIRQAVRVLDRSWRFEPHPELAEVLLRAYGHQRSAGQAKSVRRFMKKQAMSFEKAICLSSLALNEGDVHTARREIAPYLQDVSVRLCTQMAAIEAADGNHQEAEQWISAVADASDDPAWIADGHVSEKWYPLSPSGEFDGYSWEIPPRFLHRTPANLAVVREPVFKNEPREELEIELADGTDETDPATDGLVGKPSLQSNNSDDQNRNEPMKPLVEDAAIVVESTGERSEPAVEKKNETKVKSMIQTVKEVPPQPDDPGPDVVSDIEVVKRISLA